MMNKKMILIKSTNNTDTLISVDKIQYVSQKKMGVEIGLRDNVAITTDATFNSVLEALEQVFGGEDNG